ncbi:MAG TPA: DUF2461 domain-containing protein [Polyangia bacterium]|jgi:uncharacterized protein (TIGR02453 family)
MTTGSGFNGFPRAAVTFLRGLVRHNDRAWFTAHKAAYEEQVVGPAQAFVLAMGARLARVAPEVNADPRVNRSLFRVQRDVRFAKDQRPYKEHLGIWMWDGPGARMESSGFYFHLQPPRLMLAAGMKGFPPAILTAYRDSVVHEQHGPALARAIAQVERAGFTVGGVARKRVPQGYDREHPRAALLLYDGMFASLEQPIPDALYGPALLDLCEATWRAMLPLHRWLAAMVLRAG